jgi:hypothetical protein
MTLSEYLDYNNRDNIDILSEREFWKKYLKENPDVDLKNLIKTIEKRIKKYEN